jgi:peptidase M28-like protein
VRALVAVVLLSLGLLSAGALACGGSNGEAAGKAAKVNRFNGRAAFRLLREQVELGPRPAGSRSSRRLARRLRRLLPRGHYQRVPRGLRNVVGSVRGRDADRLVVVGAHYDTKDIPGFVGANDGASGTAVVTQIARRLRPRRVRPTVVFILFDGEESPKGTPDHQFEKRGLRGSKVAARKYRRAEAMILLDFVGERRLRLPREDYSEPELWRRLRRAGRGAGVGHVFPARTEFGILDDHIPFIHRGVPSIDLIDFDFDCFHRTCDDLSVVSPRSLDAVGEAVTELLRTL